MKAIYQITIFDILNVNTKECTKCGKRKLATTDFFYSHKKGKFGLRPECKECALKIRLQKKDYYKNYYEKNKDYIKDKAIRWKKENPDKVQKHKQRYFKSWYSNENNKQQWKKRSLQFAKENRDIVNKRQGVYLKTQKGKECERRRQQKRRSIIGFYTEEQWQECLMFFEYKDAYTGEELKELSVDHLIPVSKNGTSYIWNLVPCNKNINASKNSRELEGWYKNQKYYNEDRVIKIKKWSEYSKKKYGQILK